MSPILIKLIVIIAAILGLRILYNLYNFLLAAWYMRKYDEYLEAGGKGWYIQEHRQKIASLFEKANLTDAVLPMTEAAGYGFVRTSNYQLFQNLANTDDKRVILIVYSHFKEAKGVFKNRMLETLNPFYWIEIFIFLPKHILKYLGISGASSVTKVAQLLWWTFDLIAVIVGIFFNNEFITWIMKIANES